jgi:hypothetical protein
MLDIAYKIGAERAEREARGLLEKEAFWQAPLVGAFADTAHTRLMDPSYSGPASTPILRGALTGGGASVGWSLGRNPFEKVMLAGLSAAGSRALANYLSDRG